MEKFVQAVIICGDTPLMSSRLELGSERSFQSEGSTYNQKLRYYHRVVKWITPSQLLLQIIVSQSSFIVFNECLKSCTHTSPFTTPLIVYNLQPVASGDFLLSHYHLLSYLDMGVQLSPAITQSFDFVAVAELRFKSLRRRLLLLWEGLSG